MSAFVPIVKKESKSGKTILDHNLKREKSINPYEKRRLETLERMRKNKEDSQKVN